jgi:CRISPR-associated endonuclease Csn1
MKRILGLDLGTNSIGWAVVNEAECPEEKSSIVKILKN